VTRVGSEPAAADFDAYSRSETRPPIHEADVADAAAAVLIDDGHDSQIYAMTGPEALSRIAQMATIGAALGRELTFTEQTPDEFRAEMSQYEVGDDIVKMLLDYWSDTVDTPDVPRPADALTGRPARTLAEWPATTPPTSAEPSPAVVFTLEATKWFPIACFCGRAVRATSLDGE
jgi:uncharacterized protein YbjT (DUF2867 family)